MLQITLVDIISITRRVTVIIISFGGRGGEELTCT
jgi:hypothetical protein